MIRLNILYWFHILFSNLYNFSEKKKKIYILLSIFICIIIKENLKKKLLYTLLICNLYLYIILLLNDFSLMISNNLKLSLIKVKLKYQWIYRWSLKKIDRFKSDFCSIFSLRNTKVTELIYKHVVYKPRDVNCKINRDKNKLNNNKIKFKTYP